MRIAIDTLFEHPDSPSSAIDYLRVLADLLPEIGGGDEFLLLVSPRNRKHFEWIRRPNLSLVDCRVSNERVGKRIAVQQMLVPRVLRRHRISVLYSPGNVCPFVGSVPSVLKINTLHHADGHEAVGRLRQVYRKVAFGLSVRTAEVVCANTEYTRRQIVRLMNVPPGKVVVIPEAASESFVRVGEEGQEEVCLRYGLAPGFVLFSSALYPYKNPESLMGAYAVLVKEGKIDRDLVIAGRDYQGRQTGLEDLATSLGIRERVRFLGFVAQEEMPALYSAAGVLVYPSFSETFGKPLVEAMRCGLPVVASKTTCIPEVLGGAGLLVNPRDEGEIASAMLTALYDRGKRAQMVGRGLERAREFSWRLHCRGLLSVLEEVARGSANRLNDKSRDHGIQPSVH